MAFSKKIVVCTAVLLFVCYLELTAAKGVSNEESELASILHDPELAEMDDGNVETALLNYLFAKQIVSRLRNSGDARDLLKKRSYWKQCAFNAVSCFGK